MIQDDLVSEQEKDQYPKKLLITERIGLGNLVLAAMMLLLGYFGFQINAHLEKLQNQSHQYQVAQNYQAFWKEMATVESETLILEASLGTDNGQLIVKLFEFMKVLPDKWPSSQEEKEKFAVDNPALAAAWLSYLSAHWKFVSDIESITNYYDNSVLKYSTVVGELNIRGWKSYASQKSDMIKWKKDLLEPYQEAFDLCNGVFTNKNIPQNFESKAKALGLRLGKIQFKLKPPFLKGLMEMKATNLRDIEEHT